MKTSVLPKTSLGKWSVSLAAACIILFVLMVVLVGRPGMKVGSVVANILGIGAIMSVIAALVTGLIGIIKTKERAILVFIETALCVLGGVIALIIGVGSVLTCGL